MAFNCGGHVPPRHPNCSHQKVRLLCQDPVQTECPDAQQLIQWHLAEGTLYDLHRLVDGLGKQHGGGKLRWQCDESRLLNVACRCKGLAPPRLGGTVGPRWTPTLRVWEALFLRLLLVLFATCPVAGWACTCGTASVVQVAAVGPSAHLDALLDGVLFLHRHQVKLVEQDAVSKGNLLHCAFQKQQQSQGPVAPSRIPDGVTAIGFRCAHLGVTGLEFNWMRPRRPAAALLPQKSIFELAGSIQMGKLPLRGCLAHLTHSPPPLAAPRPGA